MKRFLSALVAGLFGLVLACGSVWAQATAQINGVVRDQSGAVLPGVEITATQSDTGISRTAITNETGDYVLTNLALGPYRIEASLPGFRTYVQTGIVLQVSTNPNVNITLEIGQVSEQVEVQANASLVETRSVGVGQVIDNERILELPLNGRNVAELVTMVGAAVPVSVTNSDRGIQGAYAVVVAGGFDTSVTYMLDGVQHNDRYNNYNLPFPFPDALQEFKVETSALSAESGRSSGAQVNSVTKSGTNEFHGTLFEFARNDLFNARSFFSTTNSTLKRHQFGGMLGGPIVKNKLFFFGGFQRTTKRSDPKDQQNWVPTAKMLRGDFSDVTAAGCRSNGRRLQLAAPYFDANNQLNPAFSFSKAALNITSLLPKTDDPCGLVTSGYIEKPDENQYVGRTDYQLNSNLSLFGRVLFTKYDQPDPFTLSGNDPLAAQVTGYDNLAQSYALGITQLMGANLVNSFRLSVDRAAVFRLPIPTPCNSCVGINMYSYKLGDVHRGMRFNVGSPGFNIGTTPGPGRTTMYQANDDLNLLRGNHQIAFGGSFGYMRNNFYGYATADGDFGHNGQYTGLPLADFLLGMHSSNRQAPPYATLISNRYIAAYIADTWRASKRLTLNAGLRWEPFGPQVVRDGEAVIFSEERYRNNVRSKVFNNAPAGFLYAGDAGYPEASCRKSGVCKGAGMNGTWLTFAPRVGFAFDPKGDGKTSIRASYGMAYDVQSGSWFNNAMTLPWSPSIVGVFGSLDDPWGGDPRPLRNIAPFPGGNPFPLPPIDINAKFPDYSAYYTVAEKVKPTTKHAWNLAVQRQVGPNWFASATYIGSHATQLWGNAEQNPAIYIPGNFNAQGICTYNGPAGPVNISGTANTACSTTANRDIRRRLTLQYPQITGTRVGFLSHYEPGGAQTYNGLLMSLQRRVASGINAGANYTWSHCYGNTVNLSGGGGAGGSWTDPNNRDFDRGNCSGDRRHILNVTAVLSTPQFMNKTLRAVATGWRLSSIYRYQSGAFLDRISANGDRALTGMSNQRVNQIRENVYGDRKSLTKYLDAAAFEQPALGTLGNMAPRNIEGPSTFQFDAALTRSFAVRENHRLEFRAEAFNVTNSFRPGPDNAPNTTLNSSSFGQITSSADPRILQFAMKYVF
jgi:hypothetical protein